MSLIVSLPQRSHENPQAIEGGDNISECSPSTSFSAIDEALSFADLKRETVRKTLEKVHSHFSSIGLLTLQWKDVEDHFASREQSITQQWKESETNRKRTEWKTKRLNNKEKDLAEKSKEIDATYALVSRCYSAVLEKEMKYSRSLQEAESVRQGLELMLKQELEKSNDREKFRLRKKLFDDREVELTGREQRLNFIERGISEKTLYFESQQKKLKDRYSKLQKREDELRTMSALVKKREDRLEHRELALSGNIRNYEIKQKKLELEWKAFKEKERCVDRMLVQVTEEPVDSVDADIRFYITMNGRELLRYLSSRVPDFELESLHDEVRRALLLSANPAKLVLDALHAFYPSADSEKNHQGSSLEVVRRTCIFILERFKEMDLKIIPEEEKERAEVLAVTWKSKMSKGCLEILGFVQLVTSYRLVKKFGQDELSKLAEMVSQNSGSRSLRINLDIRDKFHDIDMSAKNTVVEPDRRSVEEIGDDIDDCPVFNTIVLGLMAAPACTSIRPCHSGPKRIIKRKKGLQKRKRQQHGEEIIDSNPKNQNQNQIIGIRKPAVKKKKLITS